MTAKLVSLTLLMVLMSATAWAQDGGWEVKAQNSKVTVYARTRAGSEIRELKTVGTIDARPEAVFRVLRDFASYRETMPYTEESKIIATEEGGRVVHFYSVVNPPVVAKRDYAIRVVVDDSQWQGGKGRFKTSWTVSNKGPAPRDGIVRIVVNEGSWVLEPAENGTKTHAVYLLYTDPGGSIPSWLANKTNSSTLPDIFEALGKHAQDLKYANR